MKTLRLIISYRALALLTIALIAVTTLCVSLAVLRMSRPPASERYLSTLSPATLSIDLGWDRNRHCIDAWSFGAAGYLNLSTFLLRVPRVQATPKTEVLIDVGKGVVFHVDRGAYCPEWGKKR